MNKEENKKIKINEFNRYLFPDLAKSLEEEGQKAPILVDDNGTVHDGEKRKLLCADLSKLEVVRVSKDSECSNLDSSSLTNEQKKVIVVDLYNQYTNPMENPFEFEDATPKIYRKSLDSHKAITKLSKRYGIKERTVYRWISDSPLTNVNGKTEKTTKVVKIEHSLLEKSDYGKDIYGEFIHAVDAKLLREKRYYVFEVNSEKYKEYLSKKKQKKSQANVHHYLYTPRN